MKDYSFAERLKLARLNKKLTQKQLGEAIGIDENTYQNYELHYAQPNITLLNLLADKLHVSVDYIIGMNDDASYVDTYCAVPFSIKLKLLRNEMKLTQAQVADLLGMKLSRYKSYENAKRQPQLEGLAVLAKFYEVSVDELLGRVPR